MDDSTAMAFGRIERALEKVEEGVEKVGDKVSEVGLTVAAHGVRLDHVERDVAQVRKDQDESETRGLTLREKLLLLVVTLGGSGAVSWIISALTDKA